MLSADARRFALWTLGSFACTALGVGLQSPTPALAWLLSPCTLCAWQAASRRWPRLLLLFLTQTVATAFAFRGALAAPGVSAVAAQSCLLAFCACIWLMLALPHALLAAFLRAGVAPGLAPVVFACAWSAVWLAIDASPVGSFANPAATQSPWRVLTQSCALLGIHGLLFLMSWPASIFAVAVAKALPPRQLRLHAVLFAMALACALLYGTQRLRSEAAAEAHPCGDVMSPPLRVSCLLRSWDGAGPEEDLWERTAVRVSAGDALVMWSETALSVAQSEEAALLSRAASIASAGSSSLLVSYDMRLRGGGSANKVALLRPGSPSNHNHSSSSQALLAFQYSKAHPVPLVEAGTCAGDGRLRFADTPAFGLVSAAVCFDLDFPHLLRQAGAARAALVLQSAQNWGGPAFAARHFAGNSLRCVENGLTLLRCGSDGVSGAVSPYGQVLARQVTGSDGTVLMELPRSPTCTRVDTVFATARGYAFAWACAAATAAAVLSVAWAARKAGHEHASAVASCELSSIKGCENSG